MLRPAPFVLALAVLAGFGLAVGGVVTAGGPQPRLPRDNLLVYRGTDGKPAPVRTAICL